MMPVIMNAISHPVEDSPGALLVGEDTHGPGSSSHLTEISFQHVGGADLFPEILGEGVIMETMVKVLLHAPDRSLGFHLPFLLPRFEAFYSFASAGSSKDSFSLGHAWFQVHSFELDSYVPQLVNDAPLHLEERIDLLRCLQKSRVAIGGDELEALTPEPPALEVYQEGSPAIDVLTISHTEGKRLPTAVLFHPQGTEHHLFLDPYLPYLLGNSVQKKEGVIISEGFGLVLLEFLIEIAGGPGYRGSAHLTSEKLLGNTPEPPGTHSLKEESADGGVNVRPAPLVFIEELEVHGPFRHPGNTQVFQKAVPGDQISQVMATAVTLPAGAAFVFPCVHFSGNLVFEKTFQKVLESFLECGGDEFPDFLLDIYFCFLYSFLWSRCWRLHGGVPPFCFVLIERVHPLPIFSNLSYIT
jgi:hypothetical protein